MGKIRDFLSFPPLIFFSLILIGAVIAFGYATIVGEQAEEEPPHVTPVVELEDKMVKKPEEITVTLKVLGGHGDEGDDHDEDKGGIVEDDHDKATNLTGITDNADQSGNGDHTENQTAEDHQDDEDHEEEVEFGGLYAKIVVYSPQGEIYAEKAGTTDEEGVVSFSLMIDENAPSGRYSVLPSVGEDENLLVIGNAAFFEVT